MIPCSSCGYQFDSRQLQQRVTGSYCRICCAIGGDKVDQHPSGYEQARFIVPVVAYCTNMLMAAIATRAEAGEGVAQAQPDSIAPAFLVMDGENLVEIQDAEGKPLKLKRGESVVGTDFKKFRVLVP